MPTLAEQRRGRLVYLTYAQARIRYTCGLMSDEDWTWFDRTWRSKHGSPIGERQVRPIKRCFVGEG